jgi:AcrR family transcriptional regulator
MTAEKAAPAEPAERGSAGRGEQTRRSIVEAAVTLFRERGYERTTMRAIAEAADVSVGNAYYYFASKDALVQDFYDQVQRDHRAAAAPVLAAETTFAARLRGVLHALVTVMTPYHAFAGKFIKVAAEPGSPVSPFSPESARSREFSIEIYRELVAGSTVKLDADLAAAVPEVLWLTQMGLTLFWVHDTSPEQSRTRLLIDRAVPLADRLLRVSRLPVLRSATKDGLALLRTLRGPG